MTTTFEPTEADLRAAQARLLHREAEAIARERAEATAAAATPTRPQAPLPERLVEMTARASLSPRVLVDSLGGDPRRAMAYLVYCSQRGVRPRGTYRFDADFEVDVARYEAELDALEQADAERALAAEARRADDAAPIETWRARLAAGQAQVDELRAKVALASAALGAAKRDLEPAEAEHARVSTYVSERLASDAKAKAASVATQAVVRRQERAIAIALEHRSNVDQVAAVLRELRDNEAAAAAWLAHCAKTGARPLPVDVDHPAVRHAL